MTILDVLEAHGDFAIGTNTAASVAIDWTDAGFQAEQVEAWLHARCFGPCAALELRDAGITPQQASAMTEVGLGNYLDTIGYKVTTGDLTVQEALRCC